MSEITWSLMHPTQLNPEYMRRMSEAADKSAIKVDSFEICALCHGLLGGLNGLCTYDEYPQISWDRDAVRENIALLKEVLAIAHASGRPVYYWHREVTVPDGLVSVIPELLDKNGEFNLLGEAFEALLRYKISKAFENVPELDGIVLTLTEADYSAIHNSTPDVYPPERVVAKVTGVFYDELTKRGKRLILRSFGSIVKDYEDILAGAKILSDEGKTFEIETKITPYDFDPFLPENPFLHHTGNHTLSAECDSLGEYLGAGMLPSENVDNIVTWVHGAQRAGVNRFAIRCDRVGNAVLDVCPINLYAYMRAIENPHITSEEVVRDYAAEHYPEACRGEIVALGRQGLECILKTMYLKGNLMFHQFPLKVSLKYWKAGGLFGLFKEHAPLKNLKEIWSILSEQTNGTRSELIAEKEEALRLAQDGCQRVETLQTQLPRTEYERLKRLWTNVLCAAETLLALVKAVAAYFDDMEAGRKDHPTLTARVSQAVEVCNRWCPQVSQAELEVSGNAFVNGLERNSFINRSTFSEYLPGPIRGILQLILQEYDAEFAARETYSDLQQLFIPGSATDEWRCIRAMHACHAMMDDSGRIVRIIGNQVFPNGTLGFEMTSDKAGQSLVLCGSGMCSVSIYGEKKIVHLQERTVIPVECGQMTIILAGVDGQFPVLWAAGIQG